MGDILEMIQMGRRRSTVEKGQNEEERNSRRNRCFSTEYIRKHLLMCSCFKTRPARTNMRESQIPNLQRWELGPITPTEKKPVDNFKNAQVKEMTTKPKNHEKRSKVRPTIREHDVCYKILMIGDSGVGKTAILRCLKGQEFTTKSFTTVGMDFVKQVLEVDGAKIKLEIWDTAGQERFRSMTRFQFRGTKGALLVYDVTDRESYKTLNYWLKMVDMEIDEYNKEPIPVMLLANKADKMDVRQVSYKKGLQLSEEHLMCGFKETSAKTGKNVMEAVTTLAQAVTEINNPKLLDSYLDPMERTEKYEHREREAQEILAYQERKRRSRISFSKSFSRRKSIENFNKCCKT